MRISDWSSDVCSSDLLGAMYKGDRSRKETLVAFGFRMPSALDNRPLKFEEWERRAPRSIYVSATPSKYELAHCEGQVVELVVRPRSEERSVGKECVSTCRSRLSAEH